LVINKHLSHQHLQVPLQTLLKKQSEHRKRSKIEVVTEVQAHFIVLQRAVLIGKNGLMLVPMSARSFAVGLRSRHSTQTTYE